MIFLNNIRVLFLCIIFAFIYGAGAIFILTWNASIVGVAIGNLIREGIGRLGITGKSNILGYFHVIG